MPVILATQETKISMILVKSQPREIVQDPTLKILIHKKKG
jgi:hypothetical protein